MKYQKKLETDCDLSNEEKRCKTVIHITRFLYSDRLDFVISWNKIKCESRSTIQEEHLRELFYTILLKINCNIPWDLSEGGRNSPLWTKDHNDQISWKTVLCSSQKLRRNFWYEQKIKKTVMLTRSHGRGNKMLPWRTKTQTKDFQKIKVFSSFQQEQLLGSLDNFQPELPDTEDDEVKLLKHSV